MCLCMHVRKPEEDKECSPLSHCLPYSLELRAPISFSPSNPASFILFSTAIAGTCDQVWYFNVGALTHLAF